jgi:hypothetical protein
MSTNVVIAIGVVAIVLIALIFGARLGVINLEFLGFKATAKAAEKKGARVENIDSTGNRNQGLAEGEGAAVTGVKNQGDDNSFIAKTNGD